MGSWKSRFEDILYEVENKSTPSEIRRSYLNKTLGSQLHEEIIALKQAYENGEITKTQYHEALNEIDDKIKLAKAHLNKVDFHEE